MNFNGIAILTAAALFAAGTAFAADVDESGQKKQAATVKSGKGIQDAYILDKKPNGITIGYKDGCRFIPFSDMPQEYRQKFGYDLIKSTRYENKLKAQKSAAEQEEAEQKARAEKRNAEADKRYKDFRISAQQNTVQKLEHDLKEAKKRLETAEQPASRDRGALGMSSFSSNRATIESPWGYGERIRSGANSAAVTGKLMKEVDTVDAKRDSQAQEVINLQLKLEAAQRTLDEMLSKN